MTDSARRRLAEMDKRMNEEMENNYREMEQYFSSMRERIEKEKVERIQHGVDFIDSLLSHVTIK